MTTRPIHTHSVQNNNEFIVSTVFHPLHDSFFAYVEPQSIVYEYQLSSSLLSSSSQLSSSLPSVISILSPSPRSISLWREYYHDPSCSISYPPLLISSRTSSGLTFLALVATHPLANLLCLVWNSTNMQYIGAYQLIPNDAKNMITPSNMYLRFGYHGQLAPPSSSARQSSQQSLVVWNTLNPSCIVPSSLVTITQDIDISIIFSQSRSGTTLSLLVLPNYLESESPRLFTMEIKESTKKKSSSSNINIEAIACKPKSKILGVILSNGMLQILSYSTEKLSQSDGGSLIDATLEASSSILDDGILLPDLSSPPYVVLNWHPCQSTNLILTSFTPRPPESDKFSCKVWYWNDQSKSLSILYDFRFSTLISCAYFHPVLPFIIAISPPWLNLDSDEVSVDDVDPGIAYTIHLQQHGPIQKRYNISRSTGELFYNILKYSKIKGKESLYNSFSQQQQQQQKQSMVHVTHFTSLTPGLSAVPSSSSSSSSSLAHIPFASQKNFIVSLLFHPRLGTSIMLQYHGYNVSEINNKNNNNVAVKKRSSGKDKDTQVLFTGLHSRLAVMKSFAYMFDYYQSHKREKLMQFNNLMTPVVAPSHTPLAIFEKPLRQKNWEQVNAFYIRPYIKYHVAGSGINQSDTPTGDGLPKFKTSLELFGIESATSKTLIIDFDRSFDNFINLSARTNRKQLLVRCADENYEESQLNIRAADTNGAAFDDIKALTSKVDICLIDIGELSSLPSPSSSSLSSIKPDFISGIDACLVSDSNIAVVQSDLYASLYSLVDGQLERVTSKLKLQFQIKRLFTTPFRYGGGYIADESFDTKKDDIENENEGKSHFNDSNEGDVVLYSFLWKPPKVKPTSKHADDGNQDFVEVLAFSRNISPVRAVDDPNDLFVFVPSYMDNDNPKYQSSISQKQVRNCLSGKKLFERRNAQLRLVQVPVTMNRKRNTTVMGNGSVKSTSQPSISPEVTPSHSTPQPPDLISPRFLKKLASQRSSIFSDSNNSDTNTNTNNNNDPLLGSSEPKSLITNNSMEFDADIVDKTFYPSVLVLKPGEKVIDVVWESSHMILQPNINQKSNSTHPLAWKKRILSEEEKFHTTKQDYEIPMVAIVTNKRLIVCANGAELKVIYQHEIGSFDQQVVSCLWIGYSLAFTTQSGGQIYFTVPGIKGFGIRPLCSIEGGSSPATLVSILPNRLVYSLASISDSSDAPSSGLHSHIRLLTRPIMLAEPLICGLIGHRNIQHELSQDNEMLDKIDSRNLEMIRSIVTNYIKTNDDMRMDGYFGPSDDSGVTVKLIETISDVFRGKCDNLSTTKRSGGGEWIMGMKMVFKDIIRPTSDSTGIVVPRPHIPYRTRLKAIEYFNHLSNGTSSKDMEMLLTINDLWFMMEQALIEYSSLHDLVSSTPDESNEGHGKLIDPSSLKAAELLVLAAKGIAIGQMDAAKTALELSGGDWFLLSLLMILGKSTNQNVSKSVQQLLHALGRDQVVDLSSIYLTGGSGSGNTPNLSSSSASANPENDPSQLIEKFDILQKKHIIASASFSTACRSYLYSVNFSSAEQDAIESANRARADSLAAGRRSSMTLAGLIPAESRKNSRFGSISKRDRKDSMRRDSLTRRESAPIAGRGSVGENASEGQVQEEVRRAVMDELPMSENRLHIHDVSSMLDDELAENPSQLNVLHRSLKIADVVINPVVKKFKAAATPLLQPQDSDIPSKFASELQVSSAEAWIGTSKPEMMDQSDNQNTSPRGSVAENEAPNMEETKQDEISPANSPALGVVSQRSPHHSPEHTSKHGNELPHLQSRERADSSLAILEISPEIIASVTGYSGGGNEEDSVVGYWRFEESEVTENMITGDLSKWNNRASLDGSLKFGSLSDGSCPMEIGGKRTPHSLIFGTERGIMKVPIQARNSLDIGFGQPEPIRSCFTVETWFRMKSPGALATRVSIRKTLNGVKQDSFFVAWSLSCESTGALRVYVAPGSDEKSSNAPVIETQPNVISTDPSTWNHVAMSISSRESDKTFNVNLYVNGETVHESKDLVAPRAISEMGNLSVTHPGADFGFLAFGGEGFQGEMVEIRFWAVARAQFEISSTMDTYLRLALKRNIMVVIGNNEKNGANAEENQSNALQSPNISASSGSSSPIPMLGARASSGSSPGGLLAAPKRVVVGGGTALSNRRKGMKPSGMRYQVKVRKESEEDDPEEKNTVNVVSTSTSQNENEDASKIPTIQENTILTSNNIGANETIQINIVSATDEFQVDFGEEDGNKKDDKNEETFDPFSML